MKPIINHFQRFFSILYYKRKKDKFLSNTSIKELNDLSEYSFLNNFGKIHYFEKDKLWLVTGYDEIKYILKNEHVFTTSELYKNIDHLEILMGELNDRSRMVRKMIKEIISEKLFAQLEIFLNLESENLINILLQKNEINFQKEFSEKITLKVMCFFFGFKDDLTTDLLKKYEPEMQDFEKIMQFFDFIYNNNAVFEENRLADQLKKLIDEKTISVEEAGLISRIVWFAGIDTTSLLISNLLISIIKDKSIVVKLKQNPKLHPKYIEEILRLSPPLDSAMRFIKTDTLIGNIKFTKGSYIYLDFRMANKDVILFENAKSLSLEKNKKRHLSFGYGVHQCLGMGLARFEANSLLPYLFTISNQFEIKETKYERDFGVVVFNKITNLTLRKK